MIISFIVLLFATILEIYYFIWFKGVSLNIIKRVNLIHILYGHGYKTLKNGIYNMMVLLVTHWCMFLWIILFYKYGLDYIILIYCWLIFIIGSIINFSYIFSEIKHLVDGVSKTNEGNKFYIKYSKLGFIGMIANLILLFNLPIKITFKIMSILLIFLLFILGMGDLGQIRNINVCGGFKHDLLESIYIFIDRPKNIFRVIFFKHYRSLFIDTLFYNFKNIKNGLKNVLHYTFRARSC